MLVSYKLFVTEEDLTGRSKDGVAATGTHYSKPWNAPYTWSLHVVTDGTLTGTWTLWGSNKEKPSLTDDTDWVDLSAHSGFVETNPAGAATKWMATPDHLPGQWFRLKFVRSGGAGNVFAYVFTPGA